MTASRQAQRSVHVDFADGNHLVTSINGSEDEIRDYYAGNYFQFGDTDAHPADKMVEAVTVTFLDETPDVHHCEDSAEDRSLMATCGANLSKLALSYPVGATVAACNREAVTCYGCREVLKRNTHENLHACRMSQEHHDRSCGYWYAVTEGALSHTAFIKRENLDNWLSLLGLSLAQPLPDDEWGCARIIGSYRTKMCYRPDEVARFYALTDCVETRRMDNASYTLAKITTDADGIKTVWFLNCNVKDRPVFDYAESKAAVG